MDFFFLFKEKRLDSFTTLKVSLELTTSYLESKCSTAELFEPIFFFIFFNNIGHEH